MSEYNQTVERNQEAGSIGIGAMIVFIALILVAAVASTIIIKTAEELQQNAENTSSDTRQQISGKVSVADVYITTTHEALGGATGTDTDVSTMTVIARVSSGSLNVQEGDISWYITCKLTYVGAASAGSTFAVVDTAVADSLQLDLTDTDADDASGPTDSSAPAVDGDTPGRNAEAGADSELELRIGVDGGGETLANLKVPSLTLGKSVM